MYSKCKHPYIIIPGFNYYIGDKNNASPSPSRPSQY